MADYLICDHYRMGDLHQSDTTAETPDQARAEAEAMAQKYGCRVYVLQVVGIVEGRVEPQWSKPL